MRFTRVPEPVPADFALTWLARYEEGRRDGTREAFAIVDDDGGFLGLALAPQIDRETRTAELGYVVAPLARGRGVASEALRQLTAWAVTELGMFRLELLISVDNAASKRVAEKAATSERASSARSTSSKTCARTRRSGRVLRPIRPRASA